MKEITFEFTNGDKDLTTFIPDNSHFPDIGDNLVIREVEFEVVSVKNLGHKSFIVLLYNALSQR